MSGDYQLGLRIARRIFAAGTVDAHDEPTARGAREAAFLLTEYGDRPEDIAPEQIEALGRLAREEVGRDAA